MHAPRGDEETLVFTFTLDKGQYATMLMRELTDARAPRGERHILFSDSDG